MLPQNQSLERSVPVPALSTYASPEQYAITCKTTFAVSILNEMALAVIPLKYTFPVCTLYKNNNNKKTSMVRKTDMQSQLHGNDYVY